MLFLLVYPIYWLDIGDHNRYWLLGLVFMYLNFRLVDPQIILEMLVVTEINTLQEQARDAPTGEGHKESYEDTR